MPYLFKLTAKQTIGGKVPKGTTIQVVEKSSSAPQTKSICEAIKNQLGIQLPTSSCYSSYFIVEKIK